MIRKINILLLTLLIIIGIGCSEDYLDTTPTDAISAEDALSTPENMMLVLNGLHRMMYGQNPLPDGYWHNAGQSHFIPMFDAIAGQVISSAYGNSWNRLARRWLDHTDASENPTENFWYQRYHFINSTNSIINAVEEGDYVIDEDMNNILGQAHAYRAWAYHQLVLTYSKSYIHGTPATDPGVPLRLESGAPYESGSRGTVQEIYNQIEADIDQAITYLETASSPDDKSHISIYAAYGIKARISLSTGNWADASAAAIAARNGGYTMLSESQWKSGFNSNDLSEVMWGGYVIAEETNYYASYFYYICNTFNGSQNRGNPKFVGEDLYAQIPATDFRRDVFIPLAPNTNPSASNGEGGSWNSDPNYIGDSAGFVNAYDSIIDLYGMTDRHNTHPYMHVKFLQKNPGTIDPDDVIYMRLSEMYLIEAEAEAMQGNVGLAQTALAVVGDARDSGYDENIFTDQTSLMAEIKFQRRLELWGEGFSFHDYIRWDDPLDHSNSGASAVIYGIAMYQDRASVNARWLWKIPQREIDANAFMTEADQNTYPD